MKYVIAFGLGLAVIVWCILVPTTTRDPIPVYVLKAERGMINLVSGIIIYKEKYLKGELPAKSPPYPESLENLVHLGIINSDDFQEFTNEIEILYHPPTTHPSETERILLETDIRKYSIKIYEPYRLETKKKKKA
ncbi:hypothetical protein OpiT1DRAFT_05402 [Opitutaceae bacterium TAV1]|nr:hypothetical protein OpiT1DRAFT_05402 [Opitutaceae bacterium TAV1]